jgi:hypothetical protein
VSLTSSQLVFPDGHKKIPARFSAKTHFVRFSEDTRKTGRGGVWVVMEVVDRKTGDVVYEDSWRFPSEELVYWRLYFKKEAAASAKASTMGAGGRTVTGGAHNVAEGVLESKGEVPTEGAPAEQPAPEECANEEPPAEEAAQKEGPIQELSMGEELPMEKEAPLEETPAEEAPAEECPAEEAAPGEASVEEELLTTAFEEVFAELAAGKYRLSSHQLTFSDLTAFLPWHQVRRRRTRTARTRPASRGTKTRWMSRPSSF